MVAGAIASSVGDRHRNGISGRCHYFLFCHIGIGIGADGKESVCLDADTLGAQPRRA